MSVDVRRLAVSGVLFLWLGGVALAQTPTAVSRAPQRPADARGTVVVPDRFLRSWDPVTIFFDADRGPEHSGPEDHPERLVTVDPPHPGAFTWLDARTLQFRPTEAWPPLSRSTWTVEGKRFPLGTLMAMPLSTVPATDAVGLERIEAVSLTFAEPIDPTALARMVTLELRPLPGVGGGPSRWMTRDDFTVKALERGARAEPATYVLQLATPISYGTRATVHLRLALEDDAKESFADISFATAEPFRVFEMGCRSSDGHGQQRRSYPISPDGSHYARDQALRCDTVDRALLLEFSAPLQDIGAVEGRNLVRVTPPVDDLEFVVESATLQIRGAFAAEQVYRIDLVPAALSDRDGRPLELRTPSELYVYFPHQAPYLNWGASQGVLERFGPQHVPLSGRGNDRLDLRLQAIDGLDRSFWPFPAQPVTVDESRQPPRPGDEPEPYTKSDRISAAELQKQIAALGSPPLSTFIDLPLRKEGRAATFGLDLETPLARVGGKSHPGTFLAGLRRIDGSSERSWMRVQITDLSLSTIEEPAAVHFLVTSLASGQPIPGATVAIEGIDKGEWTVLDQGTTGADGTFHWQAPGYRPPSLPAVKRIRVRNGDDLLVLDPTHPPDVYRDNHWSGSSETWLQWAFARLDTRGAQPSDLCHIFTDRPVYRPEDEVHLKGYLRRREKGTLRPLAFDGFVVIHGPGDDQVWRRAVSLTKEGSFYARFAEANLPTGEFNAHLEDKDGHSYGSVAFRLEAYRIPTFEVKLNAPDKVGLDRPFTVQLAASYYAGGKVAGRPVQWRVTQFPYTWTPKRREGFYYSSDGRFSGTGKFESSPVLEKQVTTDDTGGESLELNPAIEPTSQPRSYTVEATVTGADDQTVTNTRHVVALPPFVLGLKVPRYIEQVAAIEPEVIVVGPDDELLAGTEVKVRLLNRQWHSHLRASDFSNGVARYVTDVVDETIAETSVVSGAAPVKLRLPIGTAGVYVVQLEAHDQLQRTQTVAVDLYAGGEQPVAWPKPATRVFEVATDKTDYNPGDTAAVVLESPFQEARALAVVEAPEGNRYEWLDVQGGAATYKLPVKNTWVPQVPVHFVLMRGRIAAADASSPARADLGKPQTVAATAWIKVNPIENRVDVTLENPPQARPGDKVPVTIHLRDPSGSPLPGEVTLWLVDAAVLALGKEQRLDPLPDFITEVKSFLAVRDTRNLPFGFIPFAESPGGSGGEGEKASPFDKITVRRTFKPVPYFNPAIRVGPDGVATVLVGLPDDVTVFKLRAKAISGPDRFGWATGELAARLPVVVQPALPRFVRPGDHFTAAAVVRVVEGDGGAGTARVRVEGARRDGPETQDLSLTPDRPERIEFDVDIETPTYGDTGELSRREVTFNVAARRTSDGEGDAFEVKLPLRDDRQPVRVRLLQDLQPGVPMRVAPMAEPARPGTVRRRVLVSDQPGLVRMAAGLGFLLEYPHGCTEQKLSRARAYLAMRKFHAVLGQEDGAKTDKPVRDFLDWLPQVVDSNGLCSYWPGSSGQVSLTAWVVQFLTEARAQGFAVDDKLYDTLLGSLQRALRSDYSHFIDGEAFSERAWALAALADAGRLDPAYAAELARRAQFLDLEGAAQVARALARGGDTDSSTQDALLQKMRDGVIVRLYQNRETYGGLQKSSWWFWHRNELILPTETRTVAEVARAVDRVKPSDPLRQVLVAGLVTLGGENGWGSTNANAAALTALAELLETAPDGGASQQVTVRFGEAEQTLSLGPQGRLATLSVASAEAGEIRLDGGEGTVIARVETSYLPAADGSQIPALASGFVVTRELLRVSSAAGTPPERVALSEPGSTARFAVGDVVEEHVQIVNPDDRVYVAVGVPLAAGLEPLNPNLATASGDARPAGQLTRPASYVAFLDDQVVYFYDELPRGPYDFYFRERATTAGRYIQPAASAEMMYDGSVRGTSVGARVEIAP